MAVLLDMREVPGNICIDFLKAQILPTNEILKIIPLARWWRFYTVPKTGFVVTDKKVLTYRTSFSGLSKQQEFRLQDIVDHSFVPSKGGNSFCFRLNNGTECTATLLLGEEDCQTIKTELNRLLIKLKDHL